MTQRTTFSVTRCMQRLPAFLVFMKSTRLADTGKWSFAASVLCTGQNLLSDKQLKTPFSNSLSRMVSRQVLLAYHLADCKVPSGGSEPKGSMLLHSSETVAPGSRGPVMNNWSSCCSVVKSCLTLCHLMDCSPPGSSDHGISQVRMLEWVAISFSRGSSRPRDQIHVSCIGRQILYHQDPQATREAHS